MAVYRLRVYRCGGACSTRLFRLSCGQALRQDVKRTQRWPYQVRTTVVPYHIQKHFTAKSCHRQMHRYCHVVLPTVGLHYYCYVASQLYVTFLSYRANNRFTITGLLLSHQHRYFATISFQRDLSISIFKKTIIAKSTTTVSIQLQLHHHAKSKTPKHQCNHIQCHHR